MSQHMDAVTHVVADLVRGFAWGFPVLEGAPAPKKREDLTISPDAQKALEEITHLFQSHPGTLPLIAALDALMDKNEWMDDLREFLVDVAIMKILVEGTEREGEDFMDSGAWLAVEDATVERGTELLNFLVYIRDCSESEIEPSLDDFLNEFLLVSDDQFQDEFFIYESMVKNQNAVEAEPKEIIALGNRQEEPDMEAMFTPVMLFFKDRELKGTDQTLPILEYSVLPALHSALYTAISGFFRRENAITGN